MTRPTRSTALSDPESVLLEEVRENRLAMTYDEAYAFLVGADRLTSSLPKIVVAAAEVRTGAMVALVPSDADAKRLKLRDGKPLDELHATLIYLGEADDISKRTREALVARLRALVVDAPLRVFDAEGFGISVFNPPGHGRDDGKQRDTCVVLQLGGGEVDRTHTLVANGIRQVDGLKLPEQHVPWVPHVTLAYTDEFAEALPRAVLRVGPVTFDRLRLAFGGDVVDVPLETR